MDAGKEEGADEKAMLQKAIAYGTRALELDGQNPNCHKWYGMPWLQLMVVLNLPVCVWDGVAEVDGRPLLTSDRCPGQHMPPRSPHLSTKACAVVCPLLNRFAIPSGSMASHVGLTEKIKCGQTFKEHLDRCIELDPSNASSYNLLGRFSFEVGTAAG